MYMNESVNCLIGILKRQADGDYELAKELSLKGSPNWVGAWLSSRHSEYLPRRTRSARRRTA